MKVLLVILIITTISDHKIFDYTWIAWSCNDLSYHGQLVGEQDLDIIYNMLSSLVHVFITLKNIMINNLGLIIIIMRL